ncbi:MAG: 50S ribosomal protein L33 [Candidatus Saccharibacteria bacterium]|jgi:large subunit ribosomal protein L33|nr:50S ribosomal protein L33 [Patescibacteria group bacterium]
MAKNTKRQIVVLKNKATGTRYFTVKNTLNTPDKLEMKKFDSKSRKVEKFVEVKAKLN